MLVGERKSLCFPLEKTGRLLTLWAMGSHLTCSEGRQTQNHHVHGLRHSYRRRAGGFERLCTSCQRSPSLQLRRLRGGVTATAAFPRGANPAAGHCSAIALCPGRAHSRHTTPCSATRMANRPLRPHRAARQGPFLSPKPGQVLFHSLPSPQHAFAQL